MAPNFTTVHLHSVSAEDIATKVLSDTGAVVVKIGDALAFFPEGDDTDAKIEALLSIARTLKAHALDLAAERAPSLPLPGQWGKGMGSAATALRHANEQALGGVA
jgi:crotonobetainyl-CoA:carnitine CoA-transferase CaiB-like acyl-CoA transferase